MRLLSHLFIAGLSFLFSWTSHAQSPYLPVKGHGSITPYFTYHTFDRAWFGRNHIDLLEPISQYNLNLAAEYAITDDIAADAVIGLTYSDWDRRDFPPGSPQTINGIDDTKLGIRWRLLDEFLHEEEYVPTLTWRIGGIIEGTYDTGFPLASGDGASGVETSLLYGWYFGKLGGGIYGNTGYRYRLNSVPDDIFTSLGLYKNIGKFSLKLGARHNRGLSGGDIASDTFTFSELPEVKEIYTAIDGGVSYRDVRGVVYSIDCAAPVEGRNTPDKISITTSVSIPF